MSNVSGVAKFFGVVLNAFIFPGLGSLVVTKFMTGLLQIVLMVAAFGLAIYGFVLAGGEAGMANPDTLDPMALGLMAGGGILSVIIWIWSIITAATA